LVFILYRRKAKPVKSDHLPEARILRFMMRSVQLTEEENEHISGWKYEECAKTLSKVMTEAPGSGETTSEKS
jgi:hypothetical protein